VAIRVLLVDDVLETRRLIRTALRFRGSFVVAGEAADGREAVALAEQTKPDVVVLDVGLPDLAGQDVLTRIRHVSPTSRVMIFSGVEPDPDSGLAHRVEAVVLKDADLDYLVDLLEDLGRQRAVQATLSLGASLESPATARSFVRSTLADWDVDGVTDDVQLVVTELVANAVTHAGTGCDLRLSVSPAALRVEVIDYGAGTPDPMPPSMTRNHGRGLHLIDALTLAWGVEPLPQSSKLVWAELPWGITPDEAQPVGGTGTRQTT
jgi:DNA-binding NarL/FixJ family response regulator